MAIAHTETGSQLRKVKIGGLLGSCPSFVGQLIDGVFLSELIDSTRRKVLATIQTLNVDDFRLIPTSRDLEVIADWKSLRTGLAANLLCAIVGQGKTLRQSLRE